MYQIIIHNALCATKTFLVNNIDADIDEFGTGYDQNPSKEKYHGCRNRIFMRIPPTTPILTKYHITIEEYNAICSELEQKLSFGKCNWCV